MDFLSVHLYYYNNKETIAFLITTFDFLID